MSDSARGELADLARLLGAHLEWQRELGLSMVRSGEGAKRAPREARATRGANAETVARGANTETVARGNEAGVAATAPGAPPVDWRSTFRNAPMPTPTAPPPITSSSSSSSSSPGLRASEPAVEAKPVDRPALVESARAASREAQPATAQPVRALALYPEAKHPRIVEDLLAGDALEGQARLDALEVIRAEVEQCTSCRLAQGRTRTVFARGSAFAPVAFVGEGPGRDEDLQGLPFVGAAGQLLDRIIGAMGLRDGEVWVGNVVKCRPPNNRVPAPDEMGACGGYLKRQLALVRPRLIVALGKTATGYLLGSEQSMSKMRGKWFEWHGVPLLPTWHPAYLLRQPDAKRETWDDMKRVLERLGRTPPTTGRAQP